MRISLLSEPGAPGIFPGMPLPALNGSVWTIAYEFRCYILVAALGLLGFRKLRPAILVGAIACLFVDTLGIPSKTSPVIDLVFGMPDQTVRLTGMFAVGMLFYLYQERIPYDARIAAGAASTLLASSFVPSITYVALATCGAYLIFWFSLKCPVWSISSFTNHTDLSYGIYLYAWPVQITTAYLIDSYINSWLLSLISLVISAIFAYFSWIYVEKPSLDLAHRRRRDPVPDAGR